MILYAAIGQTEVGRDASCRVLSFVAILYWIRKINILMLTVNDDYGIIRLWTVIHLVVGNLCRMALLAVLGLVMALLAGL